MLEAAKVFAAVCAWAIVCRLALSVLPSNPPTWAIAALFILFVFGLVWIGAFLAGGAQQANTVVRFGAVYFSATICIGVVVMLILASY
jgi:hypothetical protein